LGDLEGFSSAVVLAMISLLIGYEAVSRLIWPVAISFDEAIPIAILGLIVNIASVFLLSGGGHGHGHGHAHGGDHDHKHEDAQRLEADGSVLLLEIFEEGVPPRFSLSAETAIQPLSEETTIETVRVDGTRQVFTMMNRGDYLESVE
jgi:Co/Zn/Cd efflux system component